MTLAPLAATLTRLALSFFAHEFRVAWSLAAGPGRARNFLLCTAFVSLGPAPLSGAFSFFADPLSRIDDGAEFTRSQRNYRVFSTIRRTLIHARSQIYCRALFVSCTNRWTN